MGRWSMLVLWLLVSAVSPRSDAFAPPSVSYSSQRRSIPVHYFSESDNVVKNATFPRLTTLKQELLSLASTGNRGFGVSGWRAQGRAATLLQEIEACNQETNATLGFSGTMSAVGDLPPSTPPLEGTWRLVWTTSPDVMGLNADPLLLLGEIYQVVQPPFITNLIDFVPRAQRLLPTSASTRLRLGIVSQATATKNELAMHLEHVRLQPLEILGRAVDIYPPTQFEIPQVQFTNKTFNVTYLDPEVAILRQLEPIAGAIALVKEDFVF
eukprot:CAMPEP_0168719984 /NCGR_PEP_ID=MMETSP0724-20121128/1323_1 /TAXON_ID=265536 /ORGANISM="Amphiprora sp., Strain CCMP467" /LENGTH=267 /DNA_ID=CAMNT_0008766561 /DNA_START=88 /DNA_END=891 /DNA_ORIENTATION=+